MSETIKYGVIGSGVMGQEHIQNINIIESNGPNIAIWLTKNVNEPKRE